VNSASSQKHQTTTDETSENADFTKHKRNKRVTGVAANVSMQYYASTT